MVNIFRQRDSLIYSESQEQEQQAAFFNSLAQHVCVCADLNTLETPVPLLSAPHLL